MAELVVGVLLHATDAMLVEELHIVAGVAEEEIVGTHTQPEQADLAVRLLGVVIDMGQGRGGERTVTAQIGELVEIGQTIGQSLVASS